MNTVMSQIVRTLYGSLWKAAIPILRRHKRIKVGFDQRLVPPSWPSDTLPPSSSPLFWIQAASGGESTLLFPLIEALSAEYTRAYPHSPQPSVPRFLCTTCTEQGMEMIHKGLATLPASVRTHCIAAYFPLDSPAIMKRAIQQARPRMVLLLETELWPGLLHELKQAAIPYVIVNGRMTEKTCRAYTKVRSFFTNHRPCHISATTAENASRFDEVFSMPASAKPTVTPNIKFDIIHNQLTLHDSQSSSGYEHISRCIATLLPSQHDLSTQQNPTLPPIIALASVREEEEEQVGDIVQKICQHSVQGAPALCLLAPRHLHRIPFWREYLEKSGVPFVLKSQLDLHNISPTNTLNMIHNKEQQSSAQPAIKNSVAQSNVTADQPKEQAPEAPPRYSFPTRPQATQCILWDTFGELTLLYALADVAFVGGSLAPLGGQNFLEPLAQGTRTVIGPSWYNFSWVGKELFMQNIITEEPTSTAVTQALLALINTQLASPITEWPNQRAMLKKDVRSKLLATIRANTGGSRQTAEQIFSLLP